MRSLKFVVLGIVPIAMLSACGHAGGPGVTREVRDAARRGDLAAFTIVTNAIRANALPSGTRLYRIDTPGACGASNAVVRSCYSIVPVLPGKTPPVDVSRATATYAVP